MTIAMVPVESSNLRMVGYDAHTRTLVVFFKNGGVYDYAGITPDVYAALLAAESKGKYFMAHIRGHYDFKRQDG